MSAKWKIPLPAASGPATGTAPDESSEGSSSASVAWTLRISAGMSDTGTALFERCDDTISVTQAMMDGGPKRFCDMLSPLRGYMNRQKF